MTEDRIKDAALSTPDPERALKNLSSFLAENPLRTDELNAHIRETSVLFSHSQFLANYCIKNPDELFKTLSIIHLPFDQEALSLSLRELFNALDKEPSHPAAVSRQPSLEPSMKAIREFRMRELLKITLRDILKKSDIVDTMLELTALADSIIEHSLRLTRQSLNEIYGDPSHDAFSVISLGKLGGEELNFSSDVDLIYAYGTESGETAGVTTPQGVTAHRISNHEYYCKLGETLTRFLSLKTDSGFVYRVDLRLRPEGQKGDIALSMRSYEMYYESWGRAWERAMLLRARPVAGDGALGNTFMEMIRPFVYRKYLDYSSIEEIKRLKTRIDSTFKRDDIKRGYGGIREIEFFTQAFQLIYGGRESLLRERGVLKVLHRLLQKALIGYEDYRVLSENYRFFRVLEHRLQQLNDLQTHRIPSEEAEQQALAKKMGFQERTSFLDTLGEKRRSVRIIYDSLFAEQREPQPISRTFFDEEFSEAELKEYLSKAGIRDVEKALRNIKSIKDSTFTFQTLRGRRLLSEILPVFVDFSLKSSSPDTALNHLQSFAELLSLKESYLDIFSRSSSLIETFTYVFAQSEYLSKMLINRPQYLEMIGWHGILKRSLIAIVEEIRSSISSGHSVNDAIRLMKQMEEIRLGLLFLQKRVSVVEVIKGLSKAAQAILIVCMDHLSQTGNDITVIGLGKLGGRELGFNADLDMIFASPGDVTLEDTKAAEKLLRMLISYTREGIAYRVDTRLRPEGSKGPLVGSLEGFRKYYEKAAAFWEFQALLKARPVSGNVKTGLSFLTLARDTLTSRGKDISAGDIRQMRDRIVRELAKESEGYDVKLGPGGIEDIEFTVQYLQLTNCHQNRRLLVQGTLDAIDRLGQSGIIRKNDAALLHNTYLFYRSLECFLRLRGETILRKDKDIMMSTAEFMEFEETDQFAEFLQQKREAVRNIVERYLKEP